MSLKSSTRFYPTILCQSHDLIIFDPYDLYHNLFLSNVLHCMKTLQHKYFDDFQVLRFLYLEQPQKSKMLKHQIGKNHSRKKGNLKYQYRKYSCTKVNFLICTLFGDI